MYFVSRFHILPVTRPPRIIGIAEGAPCIIIIIIIILNVDAEFTFLLEQQIQVVSVSFHSCYQTSFWGFCPGSICSGLVQCFLSSSRSCQTGFFSACYKHRRKLLTRVTATYFYHKNPADVALPM